MALYRNMGGPELERQYNARGTVDDIQPYLDAYARLSEEARKAFIVQCNISYGHDADESLDFFPAEDHAPLFLFIHGGYWRALSKDESSFFAKPFVERGIAVAAVDYSLAPAASLDIIVDQVRRSLAHVWKDAAALGVDRNRIFVAGSSAGGHLAAMVAGGDWKADHGLPDDAVAGCVCASGLFDLEPLLHCAPNEWLQLDADAAFRNSPIHHLPKSGCPLIVTWGGTETDEFKRQSKDFAKAWGEAGFQVDAFEVSDRNHFDIILDLTDPYRDFTRRVFAMIDDQ